MNNPNKPAFPAVNDSRTDARSFYEPGLTKREYFAVMAMQAVINSHPDQINNQVEGVPIAIKWADELLKQLERI